MTSRLGVIANARLTKVNEETGIKEYIEEKHIRLTIYGELNAKTINIVGDLPHFVLWLHNKEKGHGHWESIGPSPNLKGIKRFRNWGLEKTARDIIMAEKLYRVTKDAFIRWNKFYEKDDPYDFPILEPQKHAWLYKYPPFWTIRGTPSSGSQIYAWRLVCAKAWKHYQRALAHKP